MTLDDIVNKFRELRTRMRRMRTSYVRKTYVRYESQPPRPMTPEEEKAFDAAFKTMDKAFDAMSDAFDELSEVMRPKK